MRAPLKFSLEKRKISFSVIALEIVANKPSGVALEILLFKKRSLPPLCREICKILRPLNGFQRTSLGGVKECQPQSRKKLLPATIFSNIEGVFQKDI